MAGQIDSNGFPDFTLDFDGRMISAAGGQSGNLVLLNGQELTMPWKAQQEIAGTIPALFRTVENEVGNHSQQIQIWGSDLTGMIPPTLEMSAFYPDDTSSGGSRSNPSISLNTGNLTGDDSATLAMTAGTGALNPRVTIFGDLHVTGTGLSLSTEGIESHPATDLTITSHNDLTISTDGTGSLGGDDITIDALADLLLQGATVTIVSDTGVVDIDSADALTLDSGTGAVVSINAANDRAVRANGWPLVPLRNVGTAVNGTAPATTAAAPAYKMQAGKATVTFTAGAGTVTFPTAFATGLLCVILQSSGNDVVLGVTIASSTRTSAAVTCYIAGAAAAGAVDLEYIAIGW